MQKSFLVADSGGSKTDWCYVDTSGERTYFTTCSFHPSNWNKEFKQEFSSFWNNKNSFKESEVYCYGAGCLNKDNQQIISDYFKEWGFTNVTIHSDVLGACHSVLKGEKGLVAIIGTGSVLCEYRSDDDFTIHGGLGYLIGDEGSGYYFGKLLVSAYLNNALSKETTEFLKAKIGGRSEVLSQIYSQNGKSFLSSLSFESQELKTVGSDIERLHKENLSLFVSIYLKKSFQNTSLSIVGSYGFYSKEILKDILQFDNILLINCIRFPIIDLTDYIVKSAF